MSQKLLLTCMSSSWGGLEMVGVEFAHACLKRGLDPIFACYDNSPASQRAKDLGLTVVTLPEKSSFLSTVFWFRRVFKHYGITKVVVQKLSVLKPLRFAVIGQTVEIYGFAHMIVSIKKTDFFHRFVYGRLKVLIALTKSHKDNLAQHLPIAKDQISVIPNWIAPERSALPAVNVSLDPNNLVAAVASRLDPQKGQDLAIEAVHILNNEGLKVRLLIFGENTRNESDYGKKLKQMVKEFGLESQVEFVGYTENILKEISKATVLLVPSWRETFGRVVIEAMSVGVPVVGSRAGGIPDILTHRKNGMLFETRNALSLAQEMRNLLTEESLYQQVRDEALRNSARYSQDRIMDEILGVIECD